MAYKLIHITATFRENKTTNYKTYNSIPECLEEVLNKSTASYEVLDKEERKLYFDIENIPKDKPELINDIIRDINKVLGKDIKYHLSFNQYSKTHLGLSYHLVYDCIMDYKDMKILSFYIKDSFPDYEFYIDSSVYSRVRLFRLPLNGKPNNVTIDNEDVHKIVSEDDTINNFFIQNVEGLETFNLPDEIKSFNVSEYYKKLYLKPIPENFKHSAGVNEIKELVEKRLDNLEQTINQLVKSNEEMAKTNKLLMELLMRK